jgi:hypothetical protein
MPTPTPVRMERERTSSWQVGPPSMAEIDANRSVAGAATAGPHESSPREVATSDTVTATTTPAAAMGSAVRTAHRRTAGHGPVPRAPSNAVSGGLVRMRLVSRTS